MNRLNNLPPLLIVLSVLITFPGLTEACGSRYCVHPRMQHGNVQEVYPMTYGMYPMYGMSPMYGMNIYPTYGMTPVYGMGMNPMYGMYSMNMNYSHPTSIRGCVH